MFGNVRQKTKLKIGNKNTMSNRICIEPTEFKNVRSGTVSYGYRAYDDYGNTYDNNWDAIPDDDLEVLKIGRLASVAMSML